MKPGVVVVTMSPTPKPMRGQFYRLVLDAHTKAVLGEERPQRGVMDIILLLHKNLLLELPGGLTEAELLARLLSLRMRLLVRGLARKGEWLGLRMLRSRRLIRLGLHREAWRRGRGLLILGLRVLRRLIVLAIRRL